MIQKLLTLALTGLVSFGGLIGTSTYANAGGPDVRFGIYVDDGHRDYRRVGYDRPPRYAPPPPRRICTAQRALNKARNMGLRRARIVDAGPRRVVVAGFDRHGRDRVVFANQRGCPVLRR